MTENNCVVPPVIGVVMGSQSDMPTMKESVDVLHQLKIPYELKIISAHRTPKRLYEYAQNAESRGLKAIIAGAGGAAHLPGMLASLTTLPILGVPIKSNAFKGLDSLLSIVQMPAGIPVATFAVGEAGAKNAALFAASILSNFDKDVDKRLKNWRENQTQSVAELPK